VYDEFTVIELLSDQLGILPKLADDMNRFSVLHKQLGNILDIRPNAARWGRRILTANDEVLHLRGLHSGIRIPEFVFFISEASAPAW
jgi:hypothetical protein